MNLFNHLGIAIKLKHNIEMNFHIRLKTINFLLGSIKPDISSRYINIPHYKKDSEGFIQEEIRSILEEKIYEFTKCTSNFSERLGVITHYLSDFFCYAHSDYFTGGMPKHYIYEMQLFIYDIINSKTIIHSCSDNNIVINHNASSIWSYIDELHKNYLCEYKEDHNCIDMSFTLKACTSLCFSIITECIVSQENLTFHESLEEKLKCIV